MIDAFIFNSVFGIEIEIERAYTWPELLSLCLRYGEFIHLYNPFITKMSQDCEKQIMQDGGWSIRQIFRGGA